MEKTLSDKSECDNLSSFHNAHNCPKQEDCDRIYREEDVKEFIQKNRKIEIELLDFLVADIWYASQNEWKCEEDAQKDIINHINIMFKEKEKITGEKLI